MLITPASPEDFARLIAIWEAAVRATHNFLSEDDIAFYRPMVRDYLEQVELAVARDDAAAAIGFAGISPANGTKGALAKLAMLFVDPARHGKGTGRALVLHAASKHGDLEVDVNEQNTGSAAFYDKCGFVRTGRSPLDEQGRPFPLLHLLRKRALPE